MKILYIALIDNPDLSSGVLKKINSKIEALIELGVEVRGVSFSSEISSEKLLVGKLTFIKYAKSKAKYFYSTINNKNKFKVIYNYLLKEGRNYDFFIFRNNFSNYPQYKIFKEFGHKMLIEHNTKELNELRIQGKAKWKLFLNSKRPGYLLTFLEHYLFTYFNEYVYGRKILGLAKMGIAVTDEISKYEKSRNQSYSCVTMSNGIDYSKSISIIAPTDKLRIVFLVSKEFPWHGLDRLLKGAVSAKNKIDFRIDVIGNVSNSTKDFIKVNKMKDFVYLHKNCFGEELNNLLSSSNIGVGSLGLHRMELSEASPLKTRDYFARGLPVVLAYNDTDIVKNEMLKSYTLNFSADESAINIDEINRFFTDIYSENDVNFKIRNLSKVVMDVRNKVNYLMNQIKEQSF